MDKRLVKRGVEVREQIYQFIIKYISENTYAPTIREIGKAVGLKSTSSVYNHLIRLEQEGRIEIKAGSPRAIRVIGFNFQKSN